MDTNDPEFGERFSQLSNALQAAMLLANQRVVDARADMADADQLHAAIASAVEAARHLRRDGEQQS
jgi:hypothetical protein